MNLKRFVSGLESTLGFLNKNESELLRERGITSRRRKKPIPSKSCYFWPFSVLPSIQLMSKSMLIPPGLKVK